MNYHCYQFNQGREFYEAAEFCQSQRIAFFPTWAFINDYERTRDYTTNRLPYDEMKKVGEELFMWHQKDIIACRPKDYRCPQLDQLTIDEKGRILVCCGPQEELGNILDADADEVERLRKKAKSCPECRGLGLDYWTASQVRVNRPAEIQRVK